MEGSDQGMEFIHGASRHPFQIFHHVEGFVGPRDQLPPERRVTQAEAAQRLADFTVQSVGDGLPVGIEHGDERPGAIAIGSKIRKR